jgi:hypothetical protein
LKEREIPYASIDAEAGVTAFQRKKFEGERGGHRSKSALGYSTRYI